MALLTKQEVRDRLLDAAEVLRLLPLQRKQGFFSSWPEIAPDKGLAYGYNDTVIKRDDAGRSRVTQMVEMFRWVTNALEPGYPRKLVWMRAHKVPWKTVADRLRWSEKKVRNDHDTFLAQIALHIAMQHRIKSQPRLVSLASGSISSVPTPFMRGRPGPVSRTR